MMQYKTIIDSLQKAELLRENYKIENENLYIKVSEYVEVIIHKEGTKEDMYINNYYFGDLSKNDITLLFQALLKDDKVFIEYRQPIGFYVKEYFKIEEYSYFEKRKVKLLNRRGTKIYTLHKVLSDKY